MDRQQLIDSKPSRQAFKTDEEFEEAMGYWQSHQGRILAMTAKQQGTQPQADPAGMMRPAADQIEAWGKRAFKAP